MSSSKPRSCTLARARSCCLRQVHTYRGRHGGLFACGCSLRVYTCIASARCYRKLILSCSVSIALSLRVGDAKEGSSLRFYDFPFLSCVRMRVCVCVRVCVCQRIELDRERNHLLVFVSKHIGDVSLTPEFVCAADSTAEPAGYRSEISAVRICSEDTTSWLMRRCGVAVKSYPQNSSVIHCIVLLVIMFQKLHLGNERRRMQSKTPNRFRSRVLT